ncbi:MAG: tRNA pseudouridine(54/55) synthase Pus10 [Methanosphaera sp.]|uniref:tRNA pseudouridine(54/55) synthase Pus10 n=1 Tax=Methanosphaera sp. TaxID=2666342 RepID=UPI0025D38BA3|nr:tRNA pseudouridine(54/55) synthase Pus10 [Methanosphaera sp.]MCI5866765.1 tRNA pseudouridine(54/55) synthase Pus10 [Methanosphaera sp.]MDD6534279.1 tRNA pseudouridine(54/55) synthase Pus10 [Methanosphaera sp.]MDY3956336.1 tRNA pseudouridine(54/55) synthase Pus10 [Methanosphaera sp.]
MTQQQIQKTDEYKICHKCLKRIYPNKQRRQNAIIPTIKEGEVCDLCGNVMLHLDKIFDMIKHKIEILGVTFNSALIAAKISDNDILKQERAIHKKAPYFGKNNLRNQIKYEMCDMLKSELNKTIDYDNPEVVIMVKLRSKPYDNPLHEEVAGVSVFIDVNPLFIEGKYCKYERGIPQTKWPCSKCKGHGCDACDHTGQQYKRTVEGLIAKPALEMTNGSESKFHGSGREDIDVLMLGEGRPFVLEIKHPFNRIIDLDELQERINTENVGSVSVNSLKFTTKERKAEVKNSSTESYKVYSAIAEFENGVTSNDIAKIEKLEIINQQTPQRVMHRRADLVRQRSIYSLEVERINSKKLRLQIKCQGGLYIKELISGDDGRTQPNVSSITGNKALCTQLDVIEVHIPE